MYLYARHINESDLFVYAVYFMHIGVTRSEYINMCSRA